MYKYLRVLECMIYLSGNLKSVDHRLLIIGHRSVFIYNIVQLTSPIFIKDKKIFLS